MQHCTLPPLLLPNADLNAHLLSLCAQSEREARSLTPRPLAPLDPIWKNRRNPAHHAQRAACLRMRQRHQSRRREITSRRALAPSLLCFSGSVRPTVLNLAFFWKQAVGSTPTPAQLPPLQIIVNKASKAAIQAIEQAGGRIVCRYYNALGVRAVTKPEALCVVAAPWVASSLR